MRCGKRSAVLMMLPLILLCSGVWELSGSMLCHARDGAKELQAQSVPAELVKEIAAVSEDGLLEMRADRILSEMSLEQKICQMFIVTPEALTDHVDVTTAGEATRSALERRPVGGLVYFSGNLTDRDQIMEMLRTVQGYAEEIEGMPLFLCVDEEGGRVARIGNAPDLGVPKVKPMQAVASEQEAYEAGYTIGSYLREFGFNLDFAPDADVLTNEKNTVIGDRSFGSDAGTVLCYAQAYARGLHDNGILSTFKHFPGHGATEADTHKGFAYTGKTYDELMAAELIPFAGASGTDVVMVAHIAVPSVTGSDLPCSLSCEMVTGILRGDLGYEGLIITDAMNMGAIVREYPSGQAAVMAVQAGVDMVLMPQDLEAAITGVMDAVARGELSEERIDGSVGRIIRAKLAMGR